MAVEHITTPMALLLADPLHARAVNLLCQTYAPDVAEYIWSQWEATFQLPPTHPWAAGTKARDSILFMLQMAYADPVIATRDIQALKPSILPKQRAQGKAFEDSPHSD